MASPQANPSVAASDALQEPSGDRMPFWVMGAVVAGFIIRFVPATIAAEQWPILNAVQASCNPTSDAEQPVLMTMLSFVSWFLSGKA